MSREWCCCGKVTPEFRCWPQALRRGNTDITNLAVDPENQTPVPARADHCGDESWPCDRGCLGDLVLA